MQMNITYISEVTMGLFGGSFKLNKAKHSNKRISIEEQLHVLSNLGFRANHKDFIDWICSECSREEVESAPYYYLILLSHIIKFRRRAYER